MLTARRRGTTSEREGILDGQLSIRLGGRDRKDQHTRLSKHSRRKHDQRGRWSRLIRRKIVVVGAKLAAGDAMYIICSMGQQDMYQVT